MRIRATEKMNFQLAVQKTDNTVNDTINDAVKKLNGIRKDSFD